MFVLEFVASEFIQEIEKEKSRVTLGDRDENILTTFQ